MSKKSSLMVSTSLLFTYEIVIDLVVALLDENLLVVALLDENLLVVDLLMVTILNTHYMSIVNDLSYGHVASI
jgi:hypothetical protein